MSRWEHSICDACWTRLHPDREPTRVKSDKSEKCCLCSRPHRSGISLRMNPADMECNGEHADDD